MTQNKGRLLADFGQTIFSFSRTEEAIFFFLDHQKIWGHRRFVHFLFFFGGCPAPRTAGTESGELLFAFCTAGRRRGSQQQARWKRRAMSAIREVIPREPGQPPSSVQGRVRVNQASVSACSSSSKVPQPSVRAWWMYVYITSGSSSKVFLL